MPNKRMSKSQFVTALAEKSGLNKKQVTSVLDTLNAMVAHELAHQRVTEMRIVHSMHERKTMMAELSDGFIALPGGFGTFEEFCEIVTWAQLGLHQKPCGILNVERYYDPLMAMFDRGVEEGFIYPVNRRLILMGTDPDRLLDSLSSYAPPKTEKWIVSDES